MMQHRKFSLFLDDMLEAINRIQEYIGSRSFEEFKKNYMVVDAIKNWKVDLEKAT